MLRRKQFAVGFFVLGLVLSACSRSNTGPAITNTPPLPGESPARAGMATSLDFVKGSVSETQIVAGGEGEAIVRVTVQSGYHINANPPTYPFLKATELTAPASEGLSVGFVIYPASIKRNVSFSEGRIAVYEGEVPIKLLLKATASATRGSHTLAAKLNVQACDNQVCYPPGTLALAIPVVIK